jgi:hypothetical protein
MYFVLAFKFASKVSTNLNNVPSVIITFLILHISYGSGYLKGILDFILLNKKPVKKSMELSR